VAEAIPKESEGIMNWVSWQALWQVLLGVAIGIWAGYLLGYIFGSRAARRRYEEVFEDLTESALDIESIIDYSGERGVVSPSPKHADEAG
jgi:membrane protein DedA with SNARE-associated domain